eukprot:CAMPEP_0201922712 /NCGR_PEP_ID=MMETSP0903-20130614/10671_1 /ASSEMBLY_ACC=CAM_ASM_000552 /TAXON_ID=420261 /ORGANISM="Thalassiosira antarctica, Strain CCMP982" /LENGTH=63 /DNA_ID=CAMNT_0048459897 /DNA_START=332 /DNA_END=523 /DNA_ORIENTATION=-
MTPFVHWDLLKKNCSWAMALDFAGSFNAILRVEEALLTYCTYETPARRQKVVGVDMVQVVLLA